MPWLSQVDQTTGIAEFSNPHTNRLTADNVCTHESGGSQAKQQQRQLRDGDAHARFEKRAQISEGGEGAGEGKHYCDHGKRNIPALEQ